MDADVPTSLKIDDIVLPDWSKTNVKGRATRELILRSGLQVLVEEGYSAMSMRRVAAVAGMKFGHLTYYYPSREDFVAELLDSIIKAYEQAFEEHILSNKLDATQRLASYVQLAFDSMQYPNQAKFAPEIWALANHEPFAAMRMQDMYQRARALIVDIVAELRPDLAGEQQQALALFAQASIEAFVLFIGEGKPFQAWRLTMERLATGSLLHLVKTVDAAEIGDLSPVSLAVGLIPA